MSTCFFIGHRDAPEWLLQPLHDAVERCIEQRGITDFVVGRYGNFDHLAAEAVRKAKHRHPELRLALLVAYYDPTNSIEVPPGFDDT